ncbi:MAG: acetyltransferase [Gammaproteobacteria bacterium]|nr:acetyltransferase [Gammaproteobacteria bacterium]
MSLNDRHDVAKEVREACIQAALSAYEDASISGLCGEGAFEAAISAMRMLDVEAIGAAGAAEPGEHGNAAQPGGSRSELKG